MCYQPGTICHLPIASTVLMGDGAGARNDEDPWTASAEDDSDGLRRQRRVQAGGGVAQAT